VARQVKKLVNTNKVPNLKNMDDISELLLGNKSGAYSSESEADDLPNSKVTLG